MYSCVRNIYFVSFCGFTNRFWNCLGSVVCFVCYFICKLEDLNVYYKGHIWCSVINVFSHLCEHPHKMSVLLLILLELHSLISLCNLYITYVIITTKYWNNGNIGANTNQRTNYMWAFINLCYGVYILYPSYDVNIWVWNCTDNVVFFVFHCICLYIYL